eukprot:9735308-Lingulodinium_polyedra.AAC.1
MYFRGLLQGKPKSRGDNTLLCRVYWQPSASVTIVSWKRGVHSPMMKSGARAAASHAHEARIWRSAPRFPRSAPILVQSRQENPSTMPVSESGSEYKPGPPQIGHCRLCSMQCCLWLALKGAVDASSRMRRKVRCSAWSRSIGSAMPAHWSTAF